MDHQATVPPGAGGLYGGIATVKLHIPYVKEEEEEEELLQKRGWWFVLFLPYVNPICFMFVLVLYNIGSTNTVDVP